MKRKFNLIFGTLIIFCLVQIALSATFTVTNTDDDNDGTCDADCTLREAITAANDDAADDIIEFDGTVFGSMQTITLTLGEIVIINNGSLTFNGTGADMLSIDGNMSSRIFTIADKAVATINDATFTNGNGEGAENPGRAGAIYVNGGIATLNNLIVTNNTAVNGGGSVNTGGGILTINNCIYSNNMALTSSGGALQNFSSGTLLVTNSTFMNNTNTNTTGGGAMQLNGTATIVNSTFTGNEATGGDGGAISSNGSFILIVNSTFSGNTAFDQGGAIIRRTTNVNMFLRNNIIAGNTSGDGLSPDVFTNASLTSEGNNIIGEDGPSMGWIASDMLDTDPTLLPLADNGGFGMTFLPMTGSPAIDGGQNCVLDMSCATNNLDFNLTDDQRGILRTDGSVDIGAVEIAGPGLATVSGRVVDNNGNGIANVSVFIAEAPFGGNASSALARTNSFGFFTFTGIETGITYSIGATSKELMFDNQIVKVNSDVNDIIISSVNNNNPIRSNKFGKSRF